MNSEKISFISPEEYISSQPMERQEYIEKIRQVILASIPEGFEEIIQYGMISYVVPHRIYPKGYHVSPSEPLPFIALANQKNYIAFYHMGIYSNPELLKWFQKEYVNLNIGKLDMGKSCIRFKKMDQIPYELLGLLCEKISVEEYIRVYEESYLKR